MMKLSGSMPHPDNHVEWSLYTSPNDAESLTFTQQFKIASGALGSHASSTPHYGVLDGNDYHCNQEIGHTKYFCGAQCTNNGRYCAEDPEHDQSRGLDGEDVVQENLRQICIWKEASRTKHRENGGIMWGSFTRIVPAVMLLTI